MGLFLVALDDSNKKTITFRKRWVLLMACKTILWFLTSLGTLCLDVFQAESAAQGMCQASDLQVQPLVSLPRDK